MKGFPDLPPIWFAAALALIWGLSFLFPFMTLVISWFWILGLAVCGFGIVLILWAAFWFWRRKTTIEPHHVPGKLLVEGPFRMSRNPIYLGLVLIAAGYAIWRGNPLGALPVMTLIYVLHVRFVIPEERRLIVHLGEEAARYVAKTRRWI